MSGRILARLKEREDIGMMTIEMYYQNASVEGTVATQTSSGDVASSSPSFYLLFFTIYSTTALFFFLFVLPE